MYQLISQNKKYDDIDCFNLFQVTLDKESTQSSSIKNCVTISQAEYTVEPFHIQIGIKFGFLFFKFATTLFKAESEVNSEALTYLLL